MTGKDFEEAAVRHGTDKVRYMRYYWSHMRKWLQSPISILELGVFHGASVRMFAELFPQAKIHGIDINRECSKHASPPQINIHIGSQVDQRFLSGVVSSMGSVDVVIDDGSHMMDHMKTSFDILFQRLNPGGLYVVEDLGCCYMQQFGGELRHHGTFIEKAKDLVDNVNVDSRLGNPLMISGIHFYDNIVFIGKSRSRY